MSDSVRVYIPEKKTAGSREFEKLKRVMLRASQLIKKENEKSEPREINPKPLYISKK